MSVEVVNCNLKEAYGNPGYVSILEDRLRRFDGSEIIALSEAYTTYASSPAGYGDEVYGRIQDFASAEGYHVAQTPYEDADRTRPKAPEGYMQHMVVLTRSDDTRVEQVRLATRNAFKISAIDRATDTTIDMIATHLDDRSPESRLFMAQAALMYLPVSGPAVIMNDLNMDKGSSRGSRLLQTQPIRLAAGLMPVTKIRWALTRRVQMSDPHVMRMLQSQGFEDADPNSQSTFFFKGLPWGQLDHILGREVRMDNFVVHEMPVSDHHAISASISPQH